LLSKLFNYLKRVNYKFEDFKRNIPINVVLFLHQDEELEELQKFKDLAPKLKTRIEQQLRCLNVKVQVENSFRGLSFLKKNLNLENTT
jgi:hypothetical protein